jgi:hypothetical protein
MGWGRLACRGHHLLYFDTASVRTQTIGVDFNTPIRNPRLPVEIRPKLSIRRTHESLLMALGVSTFTQDYSTSPRPCVKLDCLRWTRLPVPWALS